MNHIGSDLGSFAISGRMDVYNWNKCFKSQQQQKQRSKPIQCIHLNTCTKWSWRTRASSWCVHAFQDIGTDLRSHFGHKETKQTSKTHTKDLRMQTDNRIQDTRQPVDQLTLWSTLSSGLEQLDHDRRRNVIFLHGTSNQGSRTLLQVHQKP